MFSLQISSKLVAIQFSKFRRLDRFLKLTNSILYLNYFSVELKKKYLHIKLSRYFHVNRSIVLLQLLMLSYVNMLFLRLTINCLLLLLFVCFSEQFLPFKLSNLSKLISYRQKSTISYLSGVLNPTPTPPDPPLALKG